MKAKASQQNVFVRIISSPYRALCKARDFYVRSMLDCANSNAMGLQSSSQCQSQLPRSFSVSSSQSYSGDDDYRELVRAASARTIGNNVDFDAYITKEMKAKKLSGPGLGPRALPPRSASVAMGRIDEERPSSYFGDDTKIGNINNNITNNNNYNFVDKKNELRYPRSKSHAVARTSF